MTTREFEQARDKALTGYDAFIHTLNENERIARVMAERKEYWRAEAQHMSDTTGHTGDAHFTHTIDEILIDEYPHEAQHDE
jgi:hypothetical protein